MKIFKFGGASVSTDERIKNVSRIIKKYEGEKLLIIVSAMGKTTNALEKVVAAFFNGSGNEAFQLFEGIKKEHLDIVAQLFEEANGLNSATVNSLKDFFTEIEWLLHDKPVRSYDYYYDQIVCIGELLSSTLLSAYLNKDGCPNKWVDVRDIIRTDNNFRDAKIDWEVSALKVKEKIRPVFENDNIIITQGFIGATDENESTSLGREGSDYSAAVFANLLAAESQTIWKDVQGVMNADPKLYTQAEWIPELNYREVIEMAYYGAQVIHPKTIKPLQNKGIPLLVKSFLHPDETGTCIHNKKISHLPPIIVYKKDQVMMQFSSKDFSFVSEGLTAKIYSLFDELKFEPNITQNAAISLLCIVNNSADKVEALALKAVQDFDVTVTKNLTLLTVRHYNPAIVKELTTGFKIVLQQQTPETVQFVLETIN